MRPRGRFGEREATHLKQLKLITPNKAVKLGIPAEGPVFVSPYIREAHTCSECNMQYTPLVYQAGYAIRAQHMCDASGGIYSLPIDGYHVALNKSTSELYGFLADVTPVGKTAIKDRIVRSEEVVVNRIHAFCRECSYDSRMTHQREIDEGFVVLYDEYSNEREFSRLIDSFLIPICALERGRNHRGGNHPHDFSEYLTHPHYAVLGFRFKVTSEGIVEFTSLRKE